MSEGADDARYDMVMPFISCKSHGGAYEDQDWVAGYELGIIEGQMASENPKHIPAPPRLSESRWVQTANLPQLDLMAMHYGMILEKGEVFQTMTSVRLHRSTFTGR